MKTVLSFSKGLFILVLILANQIGFAQNQKMTTEDSIKVAEAIAFEQEVKPMIDDMYVTEYMSLVSPGGAFIKDVRQNGKGHLYLTSEGGVKVYCQHAAWLNEKALRTPKIAFSLDYYLPQDKLMRLIKSYYSNMNTYRRVELIDVQTYDASDLPKDFNYLHQMMVEKSNPKKGLVDGSHSMSIVQDDVYYSVHLTDQGELYISFNSTGGGTLGGQIFMNKVGWLKDSSKVQIAFVGDSKTRTYRTLTKDEINKILQAVMNEVAQS